MISLKHGHIFIPALTWLLSSQAFALSSLSSLQQEIEQLETRVKSYEVPKDLSPAGLLNFQADEQFKKAEEIFREGEYIASIRLFNSVLNQVPQLDQDRYLKAQYLLGRSYEELAFPSRSVKSYLRYLSSYISQGGESDNLLIEVIRRLLLLEESMIATQKSDFQRLLASLMSMPLTPELRVEVSLLSSVAAYRGGRFRVSNEWLSTLRRPDVPRRIQVEVMFYEALNALALGQDNEGEKRLLEVASFKEPSFLFIRDMAALNLGRLYAARNMPQNAWSWYLKVEGPSQSLRYAAYEAVQLLQQSREYKRALSLAKTYINKYGSTPEAYRLQERISFLEMQAGELDPAEGKMRSRERDLHTLQSDLLASYRGRERLTLEEVSTLRRQTEIMALQSPLLETSANLFDRLTKSQRRIQDQKSELSSLIFTLGRLSDSRLRPEVNATNEQFRGYLKSLFAIGEELLQHDREIFDAQLSDSEKSRLDRSLARRQRIAAMQSEFQKGAWQTWDYFARSHLKLAELSEKIEQQRASLQSITYNAADSKAPAAIKEKESEAEDLLRRLQALETRLNTRVEEDRLTLLDHIRRPSPYRQTRKVLLLGTQEFLESVAIFDDYHDRFRDPARQHLQEDLEKSWLRWQSMAGHILKLIKKDEAEEAQWLEQQMVEIRKLMKKQEALAGKQLQISTLLSYASGRSLPLILDHFDHHIKEQRSRAKKWLADIQWQRFMSQTEQRFKAKTEHENVEAQLEENLKDLETERSIHE